MSTSFRVLQSLRHLPALALGSLVALSAQAQTVVYDSLAPINAWQCFYCDLTYKFSEIGDTITLAGSNRALQSISFVLVQDGSVSASLGYTANLQLNLFDATGASWTALGAYSVPVSIGALAAGPTASLAQVFTLDLSGFNVTLPNTVYVGISFLSASDSLQSAGLSLGFKSGAPLTGTDTDNTIVYGALLGDPNTLVPLGSNGLTPNFEVTVAAVPELSTYAMMALGLVGMGAMVRRRKA